MSSTPRVLLKAVSFHQPSRRLHRHRWTSSSKALQVSSSTPIASCSSLGTRRTYATNPEETEDQKKQREQAEERRRQRQKQHQENQDDHIAPGTSPWARFMDVLKSEYAKSQAMQENVRELTGTAQGLKDSEAAQKMREAYTALRLQTLIKENPRLAAMASSLSTTGRSVSDAVNKAAQEIEDSRLVQAAKKVTAELDRRIGEPIRQTEVYKVVEDTVDFSQGALRYGGYIEKAERRRKRQKRLERLGKSNKGLDKPSQFPENPQAPPALVLHATANQEAENESRSTKSRLASITPEPILKAWTNFQNTYEDSDNPVIASMRTVTGAIGRLFDETETAKVVRLIKEIDRDFEFDGFLRDLREYIVPEIVDAYVDADLKVLKLWTSEGAYNVITAPMQTYLQRGLRPENQVIDLKGIDIMSAKVLQERELPVFVIAFRTHEINCFTNPGNGKVEVGNPDQIEQVQYVIVMTREAEQCGNEITGGWKVIDMARRSSVAFL
ncbi:uncharacterized protein MELLADRAFT_47868 [Melampsora larici-populina 98AG31]|uniref:Mitochondrial import inner membrane translocase subunit TIM44 n=1 Tax=Melampsora larici-populina (strain 98AG31 / pathotype 3-4-7) TaxID=747676 RepID=F4RH12_MELLP|nr:uncharacterized protein MELLADRAFT_47868 [Melampsora larici-populina 98AG31]EGG08314.1 hypothetical protein MELLADRAFT_47868 [Melampsora larici-populina 98AG31]